MRPRPVIGEATVPDAVRRLLDKFDYPDREAQPQVIPILPTLGGGNAPTLVVAASNAPERTKARADYVCIGVNDETTVQVALNEMALGAEGRLVLTEGDFYFTSGGVTAADRIEIQGMGFATFINVGFTTGTVFTMGNDSILRDLQIGKSVSA